MKAGGKTVRSDEPSIRNALQAATAHHQAGRLGEAEAVYRRVLEEVPNHPDALVLLGALAHRVGRPDMAVDLIGRALRVNPATPNHHYHLGLALHDLGRLDEAFASYRAALQLQPDYAAAQFGFARCVVTSPSVPTDAGFRDLLARALSEGWARPADLARTSSRLIAYDPAFRQQAPLAATLSALSGNRLLHALLESAQVFDAELERFLAVTRHRMLDAVLGPDSPHALEESLVFLCALARQCFLNDFVFFTSEDELDQARLLRDKVAAAAGSGAAIPPLWLAAVGAYLPLGSIPHVERLEAREWPLAVEGLLAQQVMQPAIEKGWRDAMPRLTPIADDVSRSVQRQYEENPYPKWVRLPPVAPLDLDAYLRQLFPLAPFRPLGKGGGIDMLVAGCGTGQESIDVARQFPEGRVLAVDLSLASLGYAARKAHELGAKNVEHAQGDIVELGSLGRTFDVISSVGVLHHLAQPLEGWRELVSILRPGGLMLVGLYSEHARLGVVAAREFIAARGYGSTAAEIRRARQDLLSSGEHAEVTALRDFFGTNECRDLLFHVQEHRFTLPRIKEMLATLGLDFLGFVLEPAAQVKYRQRFPKDTAAASLDRWNDFEREFPQTFAGMYAFWVQKRPE